MITRPLPEEGPLRLGSVTLPAGRLIIAGDGAGDPVAWATVDPVPEPGWVWAALSEAPPARHRCAGRGRDRLPAQGLPPGRPARRGPRRRRRPHAVGPAGGRALLPGQQQAPAADLLSEREKQVLRLVAQDLANKQIARRLGISENTVKVHIGNVFRRIGVRDRISAALWARENLKH